MPDTVLVLATMASKDGEVVSVYCGGASGVVRVWNMRGALEELRMSKPREDQKPCNESSYDARRKGGRTDGDTLVERHLARDASDGGGNDDAAAAAG